MSVTRGANEAPVNSQDWPGRILSIYNGSDQPVFLTHAIFVANPNGGPTVDGDLKTDSRGNLLDVDAILPAASSSIPVPANYSPTIGVYGDFVIVEFLDAAGAEWRRRSDSFELERLHDFRTLDIA